MTKDEMCEYLVNSRRERGAIHRLEVTCGDIITGFTDKEYRKIEVRQKSTFSKGKKHTNNRYWDYNNSRIKITPKN